MDASRTLAWFAVRCCDCADAAHQHFDERTIEYRLNPRQPKPKSLENNYCMQEASGMFIPIPMQIRGRNDSGTV